MEKRLPGSDKPAALMISPEAPYPLDGGGALRTASLLHYLALRYRVDLIAFAHPGQKIVQYLPPGLVANADTIALRPHRTDLFSRSARNAVRLFRRRPPLLDRFSGYDGEIASLTGTQRYDIVLLEHFWAAPYLALAKRLSERVLIDLHNVESVWHAGCAASATSLRAIVHRRFANAAADLERRWLPLADLALVASQDDAQRIQSIAPQTSICVYPNSLPWRNVINAPSDFAIAFSGNMEYEPNRTGLRQFIHKIWPLLLQRFPSLKFRIIGKNAHAIADDVRGQSQIECTGPVEDTFPHLAAAQVCVAPLLAGSGTRLKVIEAWAACRAVVSTHIGAEGLGATDEQSILLADEPRHFADQVSRVLENADLRRNVASAGRLLYEQNFTWNRAWESLSRCNI